jgi:hypothetical protein
MMLIYSRISNNALHTLALSHAFIILRYDSTESTQPLVELIVRARMHAWHACVHAQSCMHAVRRCWQLHAYMACNTDYT